LLQAAVAARAAAEVERGAGRGTGGESGAARLLTVKEVAAILRVCTATVYSMVERAELPYVRVGNSIRICVAEPSA
jgi:excisionase family DNA binding protein